MFHSHDGWFWKRDKADVVILKGVNFEDAQEVIRFTPSEWASIVANVSEKGETADSWREALKFHDVASAKPFLVEQGSPEYIKKIIEHLS